nr:hypothetical protein [uncultured Desulfuromonas sp.]
MTGPSVDRRRVDDGRYANDRRQNRQDRRVGPDLWVQSLRWFALGGWVLIVASVMGISFAKPQTVTFFERVNNVPVRHEWDYQLMSYVLWILFAALFSGLVGLVINITRRRRKHDVFYFSLVASTLVAAIGFIWVLTL